MTTLTPADRRRLIERPFPVVRIIPPKSWAGVLIENELPVDGQTASRHYVEDSSYIRYGRPDDANQGEF